ncbi:hypothetical protein NPJ82_10190 [Sphingomonas sp. NY01]|uniref:hypothetical protein n=1 Tax=Sphingomonas sp. NY01 TaxID=2968057 RepID=UPI00315CD3E8
MAEESQPGGSEDTLPDRPFMPEAEVLALADLLRGSRNYLEFGSGGSTRLAMDINVPHIVSVETSRAYAELVRTYRDRVLTKSRLDVLVADIGNTGAWGYPTTSCDRVKWPNYSLGIWDQMPSDFTPDFILIDGRFRVATLMTAFLHVNAGCMIMIDDFMTRDRAYGAILEVVHPIRTIGRAGLFEASNALNRKGVIDVLRRFIFDPR